MYDIATSYYLDGFSLFTYFGVGVEQGSNGFLQYADRKDSTSHDWEDENGIDIDLTRVFLESREVSMNMFMIANSEADFHTKYDTFLSYLVKPGLRRLTITELGKDYFVYYKKSTNYNRYTRIKNTNQIACKFSITFIEADPTSSQIETFIVREDGSFLIT